MFYSRLSDNRAQTAALAFSVVLLPYSLIGPFVGTLLDRFSRQRIVFGSNLFRAITLIFIATLISNGVTGVELTIFVLVAFGVNRLILAGLSAGLPLLVDKKQLISYNAVAVTGGTVFVVIGGGVGIGFKHLLSSQIKADNADGYLIILASACYTIASLIALLLPKSAIGPLEQEIKRVVLSMDTAKCVMVSKCCGAIAIVFLEYPQPEFKEVVPQLLR